MKNEQTFTSNSICWMYVNHWRMLRSYMKAIYVKRLPNGHLCSMDTFMGYSNKFDMYTMTNIPVVWSMDTSHGLRNIWSYLLIYKPWKNCVMKYRLRKLTYSVVNKWRYIYRFKYCLLYLIAFCGGRGLLAQEV